MRIAHLLLGFLLMLALLPLATPLPAVQAAGTAQGAGNSRLVPLPRTCGGGLPPGEATPACCLFGYVFIDGAAVVGAKVVVSNARGQVEDWTGAGPDSDRPYFRLSLSDGPLRAAPGDAITIRVDYGGTSRTVTHTVLNGAQQVDVVLPQAAENGYVLERVLWQQSPTGTFREPVALAVDGAGTVFALDRGNARVQVFDPSGRFLQAWGDLGGAAGSLATPEAIAADREGNLFVADTLNHRVQKFTRSGVLLATWGRRGSRPGEFIEPRGIAVDATGVVYVADTLNHRIQRFRTDGNFLGLWGSEGSTPGQLSRPGGLSIADDGSVYVIDELNQRIQRFRADGTLVSVIGAGGELSRPTGLVVDAAGRLVVADRGRKAVLVFANDSATPTALTTTIDTPADIDLMPDGSLLVADIGANRIAQITISGAGLNGWGAKGDGPGVFELPTAAAADPAGNIHLVDYGNGRVQTFRRDGTFVRTWASRGSGVGQLERPEGITVDRSGRILVADTDNHRIQVYRADGSFVTSWGGIGQGPGQFRSPHNLAAALDGSIFVADTGNNRIQQLRSDGSFVRSWGGLGSGPGQFDTPRDVAVNSQGQVFVVESNNHRVQAFEADGSLIAVWGNRGNGLVQFEYPYGIAVDVQGNIFVADTGNSRVQKLSPTGAFLATWGSGGSDRGQLINPYSLDVDASGAVIVADSGNYRAQLWRPTTYTRPVATIVAVSSRSVAQGQPLTLHGMGSDSDSTQEIAALEWFLDGAITSFAVGPTVTLATAGLSLGRHTISLQARDTEGERSELITTTIEVSASGQPSAAKRWTFLLYLDGDAPNLAPYLSNTSPLGALYRLERAIPNAQVTVAALYDGPLPGGGDSFRYLIRPNGEIAEENLREVNMGDPQTLVDFVRWGLAQAPADHTYLALADHANALSGIAWDYSSARDERLTPAEIRSALVAVTESGSYPIDVLHFDGCLMGLLEPAYQVRGLARYLVASQNLGWSAFAYEQYRALVTPQLTPRGLAEGIAERYAQLVGGDGYPMTIAALDLGQVDPAARATDALAQELLRFALASPENRAQLAQLRSQAQKLDSEADFFLQNEDEYLDLDHWAELIAAGVGDGEVVAQAGTLRAGLRQLVLRNYRTSGSLEEVVGKSGAGYDLRNARGVGIYYPPRPGVRTYQLYVQGELNFVRDTRWSEYLGAGLAALPFDTRDAGPPPAEPLPLRHAPAAPASYRVVLPFVQR